MLHKNHIWKTCKQVPRMLAINLKTLIHKRTGYHTRHDLKNFVSIYTLTSVHHELRLRANFFSFAVLQKQLSVGVLGYILPTQRMKNAIGPIILNVDVIFIVILPVRVELWHSLSWLTTHVPNVSTSTLFSPQYMWKQINAFNCCHLSLKAII